MIKYIAMILTLLIAIGWYFTLETETSAIEPNMQQSRTKSHNTAPPQPPTASVSKSGLKQPSPEQLALNEPTLHEVRLTDKQHQERELLQEQLLELSNCHQTYTCPEDNSDPRASDILWGQMLAEKLQAFADFHRQHDHFDEQTNEIARQFLDHSDGFVQEAAITLLSMQAPNLESGQTLIDALKNSYDAKIMQQAMKELQRYPELAPKVDQLYAQSLQTGSFYVAQEIALNILPHLNKSNVSMYEAVADKLPQHSLRAKALKSNIKEFKLQSSWG